MISDFNELKSIKWQQIWWLKRRKQIAFTKSRKCIKCEVEVGLNEWKGGKEIC